MDPILYYVLLAGCFIAGAKIGRILGLMHNEWDRKRRKR